MEQKISFYLNGQVCQIQDDKVFWPLADFLRYQKSLTGTKIVCAEGDCGACSVLCARVSHPQFVPVNSCILPVFTLQGTSVVTVEGLQQNEALHPVQQSMVDHFGAQCGYCTPGIVCAMTALYESSLKTQKPITDKRARNALTGNLCRCTGYEPILKAACALKPHPGQSLESRYLTQEHRSQMREWSRQDLQLRQDEFELRVPTTLAEALTYKGNHPEAKIVAGATDLGVLVNKGKLLLRKAMSLHLLEELRCVEQKLGSLLIGANVTLAGLEDVLENEVPEFARLLRIFASPQIKNRATLIGNVVNGSPIGDTLPFLVVAGARLVVASARGEREIELEKFYLGYKKTDLRPDEIVLRLEIPALEMDSTVKLYKASLRKDLDISAVTFAALMKVKQGQVQFVRLALGGVGPTVLRLLKTEQLLQGQSLSPALLSRAGEFAITEISPLGDVRGSKEYRFQLSQNFFRKLSRDLLAPRAEAAP
ncbi:MAG: xanthine dehydrogenase small subunit [Bdellovibrio sp.]